MGFHVNLGECKSRAKDQPEAKGIRATSMAFSGACISGSAGTVPEKHLPLYVHFFNIL